MMQCNYGNFLANLEFTEVLNTKSKASKLCSVDNLCQYN